MEGDQPATHKLAIFGISGRTGRELAKVASLKGWEVRGFVRPTSRVEGGIGNCQIVRGNFEELDRVIETIADSAAVCCMIGPAPNRSCPMEWLARTFARWQYEAARDREGQERIVELSSLEWTIVKPPRVTDSPPQDRVQASSLLRIGLLSKISRADLAAFIFDEAQTGRFVRQRIFVKG